jgi:mRNA-degrading endonuclease RelE of RelBE toxin-antitoxin system
MRFRVLTDDRPEGRLLAMDKPLRERLIKRILRMRDEPPGRHLLRGFPFFVEEVGQYRIIYTVADDLKKIHFVGDHKEYERWLQGLL